MIDNYNFGKITIEGKEYQKDVEVRWDGKVLKWWREEGHEVRISDIERALKEDPDFIIIGIGKSKMVEVKEKPKEKILEKDIKLVIDSTPQAVEAYNKLEKSDKKVIGLFHLTC